MNHSFNNNLPLTADSSNFHYSAKHAGLYLHMSRLLRSIWRKRCIDDKLHTTISQQDCAQILEDLFAIKRFLESITLTNLVGLVGKNMSNAGSMSAGPGGYLQQQQQQQHHQQQQQHHQQTMSGLGMQSPYGQQQPPHYGSQSAFSGVPGQQKSSAEDALVEEKKSLDALTRLISKYVSIRVQVSHPYGTTALVIIVPCCLRPLDKVVVSSPINSSEICAAVCQ